MNLDSLERINSHLVYLACRLGLIGDLGQTEDSQKTLVHLDRMNVASVLNVGDLSYADSYQPRWDSWNRLLEVRRCFFV